jgi:ABC-type Fe3+ transport system substrate-binding protein
MNQLVNLVAAGEYSAAVATAGYRIRQMSDKGAPVAWHCPEPVPVAVSEGGILKGGPNIHSAYLYMNWLLSKEGQLAQYASSHEAPAHKDLFGHGFLSFPDEIKGKEIAFRSPDLLGNDTEKNFFATWTPLWDSGGVKGKTSKRAKKKKSN